MGEAEASPFWLRRLFERIVWGDKMRDRHDTCTGEDYTYEEVLEKIETARRFGRLSGVQTAERMLTALGLPGLGIPYIHVAGTNGKGSVCAFLSAILQEAGKRTGCFTSPHLTDFRERITVDGVMIPKEAVTEIGNRLLALDMDVEPTMFDYCLLMAVLYFRQQDCEFAVIETGLGGRLDATNALGRPEVSVITRIGYDHMAILGSTLAEIAAEKAGILKDGVPAVFAGQEEEAARVLRERAPSAYAVTDEDRHRAAGYAPGMQGVYQYENAAVAEAAARIVLAPSAYGCIPAGIRKARWPGRMEILSKSPFFLVDGAHNATGALALRESLQQLWPGEKFRFIMGVMADKDYVQMIDILAPLASDFFTVTPQGARALPAEALAEQIRGMGIGAESIRSVEEIPALLDHKTRMAAFGSLYFIGEVRSYFTERCRT